MTGYKASINGKCETLTYEVGKTYTFNGQLEMCSQGFHFCKNLKDVFNYYDKQKDLVIFEIEAIGEVITKDDKSVTDKIRIIRILDISEYQEVFPIIEKYYDDKNNEIYYRSSNRLEYWKKYDKNNNLIHYKNSGGLEYWKKYDKNNNLIHYKDSYGFEKWEKYDQNNNLIHYKNLNGSEYWNEYDDRNNLIHYKNSDGYEYWQEYDENNNLIHYKNSYGNEWAITIE